jgi:hypothetical protein
MAHCEVALEQGWSKGTNCYSWLFRPTQFQIGWKTPSHHMTCVKKTMQGGQAELEAVGNDLSERL